MSNQKPKAIIFDIDGTLAHMKGRIERRGKNAAPYADWDAHDDLVDEHVAFMVHTLANEFKIIICSGRKDSSREVTETWLKKNGIAHDEVFMRKADDNRKDSIVKREIYNRFIAPNYDVWCVYDDRDQVVDMWRNDLGLKCFQVAEGNF
jgi:uncharacterized HAD superfamily protein